MNKTRNKKQVKYFKTLNKLTLTCCMAGVLIMCVCLQQSAAATPKNSSALKELIGLSAFADVISVKVVDDKGEGLPGASVRVKGSNSGAITDAEGSSSLSVKDPNATLIISMIGFETQEIPVNGKTRISVTLKDKPNTLHDVIVVGYGKQSRAKVTGSVASVRGSELVKAQQADVSNSLVGRLPGLRAVQSSGEPGYDGSSIDIRGFGEALVIVDGIPTPFNQLDPNEIESISILKDASAAVYGVRAANGVILVTTKKGVTGKPSISYNSYYGFQQVTNYPKLLNAGQFAELQDEASVNAWVKAGNPAADLVIPYSQQQINDYKSGKTPGTDWYNATIRKSSPQFYQNVGVSGGNEDVKYFTNIGYLNQGGIWKTGDTKFQRYNFRSDVNARITKRLTADLNLSGRYEDREFPGQSAASIISSIKRTYPIYPVYANNNNQYFATSNVNQNPVLFSNKDYSGYSSYYTKYFSGIFSLDYAVPGIEGLIAKGMISYQTENQNNRDYKQQYDLYDYDAASNTYTSGFTSSLANLSQSSQQNDGVLMQLSLNYAKSFGKHNVSGLVLFERQRNDTTGFNAYKQFTLPGLQQLTYGDPLNQSNGGYYSPGANMGYVGKFNYDYAGKYLLEFDFRYDGTFKGAPANRFGFFPVVSAGWRISDENFMKSLTAIDNLKFRASYGKAGDDRGLSSFQYVQGNNASGVYVFGDNLTSGLQPGFTLVNPNLTWLITKTANVGFDLSMWKGLLGAQVDAFYRKRTGIYATRAAALPSTFGANLPQENLDGDNTRGFELVLTHKSKIGNVTYTISPNVSYTKTRYAHLERSPNTNSLTNWQQNYTNRNANIAWGYVAIGQFQSQAEINSAPIQDSKANQTLLPGDIRYKDLNGDGVIDSKDQTAIGRGNTPEIFYGLNLGAAYKGFDLSILLQGAANFNVYYDGELQSPFFNNANSYAEFADRWHRQNLLDPNSPWVPGKYPSTVVSGSTNNQLYSSFWLQNSTYLRVKNVDLGYTFPKTILGNSGIKSLRVYFSGENLFTFTGVKNLDPEAPQGRGDYYPQMKIWTLGLNLGL